MYAKFVIFSFHVRNVVAVMAYPSGDLYVNNNRTLVLRHCPMKMYILVMETEKIK